MKQKNVIKKILHLLAGYRWYIVASLLFAVVTVAASLVVPQASGEAVDLLLGKDRVDFHALFRILLRMGIWIGAAALTQWGMSLVNNHVTFLVVRDIRNKAFDRMQKLPLSYLDRQETGDIVSRIVADTDTFSDGLLMGFTQLFTGVLTILGTLIFMLRVDVRITAAVLVLTPVSLFMASFIAKRTYHMFLAQSRDRGAMTALTDEMVGNEKIVQAFSMENISEEAFEETNEALRQSGLQANFFSSLTNPSTRFINNIVYAVIGVVGALICISAGMTVGQLTCFLSYATQFAKPFNEISGVMTELQNAVACAGRVFELMEEPEEEDAAVEMPPAEGSVEIRHVRFSYTPEQHLIEDLNVDVRPGMRVAVVGPTGCGKSTLINLLMRFYDVQEGCISVDGRDIRKVTRDSLRKNYGMVLQETWLKQGTVRENLKYGAPDASDAEMEAAARKTHADEFIRRMPEGYDTVLTEDGGDLSAGQKQLLCITRVMLRLPPMLILDEATSSIDTRTEINVQNAFAEMMRGRTSFIVAHRLSTIENADLILVMRYGSIIEQGTHASLLRENGFYAHLYRAQFEK